MFNNQKIFTNKDSTFKLNNSACRTPYFHGWAYNARRGHEMLQIWDQIPTDTDIVMTHGPPVGK